MFTTLMERTSTQRKPLRRKTRSAPRLRPRRRSLPLLLEGLEDRVVPSYNPIITSDGGGDTASIDVFENTTAVTSVTATDGDPGDILAYSLTGAGADDSLFTIHPNTGVLSFLMPPDFEVPTDSDADNIYDVQVLVDDGNGGTDSQNIFVMVTNENDAPTADSRMVSVVEDTVVGITLTGTDADLDLLTFSTPTLPQHGTLTGTIPNLIYTPAANYIGMDSFTYVVDDGQGGSDTATVSITVTPVDDVPMLSPIGLKIGREGQAVTFTAQATDVEGDALVYSLSSSLGEVPLGAVIAESTGVFQWTPTEQQAPDIYSFTVRVSEVEHPEVFAEQWVRIRVDQAAFGNVETWGDTSQVPENLEGLVAIAAGEAHSLALKSDRTVVAWGYNAHGQANVPQNLIGVVAIAAGYQHSMALTADRTVVAWGAIGQESVPENLSEVVAIAAGQSHSVALRSDGTVVAWGENFFGEGSVPEGLTGVVAIAAGAYHNLALKSNGTVVA